MQRNVGANTPSRGAGFEYLAGFWYDGAIEATQQTGTLIHEALYQVMSLK